MPDGPIPGQRRSPQSPSTDVLLPDSPLMAVRVARRASNQDDNDGEAIRRGIQASQRADASRRGRSTSATPGTHWGLTMKKSKVVSGKQILVEFEF